MFLQFNISVVYCISVYCFFYGTGADFGVRSDMSGIFLKIF